jgi:hypothetical protein
MVIFGLTKSHAGISTKNGIDSDFLKSQITKNFRGKNAQEKYN